MFESLSNMFGGSKKTSEIKKLSEEDEKIVREINKIEGEEIQKEYTREMQMVKYERDILSKMLSYIGSYVELHSYEFDLGMPMEEFLDRVADKKDFDLQISTNIYNWIDEQEGKINMENSLHDFLDYANKVRDEDEFLLNPGSQSSLSQKS